MNLNDFEKVIEQSKPKRSPPGRVGFPSKSRLAAYNRAVLKRKKKQKFHDTTMDLLLFLCFILILYIAFGK